MKKIYIFTIVVILSFAGIAQAGLFDFIFKGVVGKSSQETDTNTTPIDNSKIIPGLKEALTIGTRNAIDTVSKTDGYFGNKDIEILMPEKIQMVANILKQAGFKDHVDNFILSMNRAAEKAGPKAAPLFVDAIKEMSVKDAGNILNGGDTAATDYFKNKTSDKLYEAFKPTVSSSMNTVGVTRSYKEMMNKYQSIITTTMPFIKKDSLDLDDYVTDKAISGLFYMVGQEEKKIRTDPAARVTDLLKTVFAK
ncbi:hypothetical protein BuS5_01697 [Desulfosarcina sp. BuS5]|uniref:DUF4197 domain-containing protein n=1 Tax=Desulfosarcina sp. BuS5 TaxID=933262 RepID=UPI000480F9A7|nr:DUF4197 domain-containing protein [Desulfosarcina sp. BuS5]WDN88729.1 hypothetical protein BuS5_01697 [Desulfosarcina sp. BuS5]